jgi:hypothetical protein
MSEIVQNWRLAVATVIVLGYGYAIVGWPLLFWLSTLLTVMSGTEIPAPPIVPWEQLAAATATLATVAGMDVARDHWVDAPSPDDTRRAQRL